MVNAAEFPMQDVLDEMDNMENDIENDNDNEEVEALSQDESDDENSYDPESATDDRNMIGGKIVKSNTDENVPAMADLKLSGVLEDSESNSSPSKESNDDWHVDFSNAFGADQVEITSSKDSGAFEVDFSQFNNNNNNNANANNAISDDGNSIASLVDSGLLSSATPPPHLIGTPKPASVPAPTMEILDGESMPDAASIPSSNVANWSPSILIDPLSKSPILSSSLHSHNNHGSLEQDMNISHQLTEATLERRNSLNALAVNPNEDIKDDNKKDSEVN